MAVRLTASGQCARVAKSRVARMAFYGCHAEVKLFDKNSYYNIGVACLLSLSPHYFTLALSSFFSLIMMQKEGTRERDMKGIPRDETEEI
eukprot:467384-Amorphochlora_amoeboformis.AAC.1